MGNGTLEVGDHELDIDQFAVADHGGLPFELKLWLVLRERCISRSVALGSRRSIAWRPSSLGSRPPWCEKRSREVPMPVATPLAAHNLAHDVIVAGAGRSA